MKLDFEAIGLASLRARRAASGRPYLEFLRRASFSVGLYELAPGAVDGQSPHTEDEVYYVISGRARFRAGEEDREVGTGDTLFVATGLPHRFHSIEEELVLLVVFAPPDGSRTVQA